MLATFIVFSGLLSSSAESQTNNLEFGRPTRYKPSNQERSVKGHVPFLLIKALRHCKRNKSPAAKYPHVDKRVARIERRI